MAEEFGLEIRWDVQGERLCLWIPSRVSVHSQSCVSVQPHDGGSVHSHDGGSAPRPPT